MPTLDSPPPLSMVLPQLSHRERATNRPRKAPPSWGGKNKAQGICNPSPRYKLLISHNGKKYCGYTGADG